MTILEDIKSGRLVVVPREAFRELLHRWRDGHPFNEDSEEDDALDAELEPSPDHTSGLIALVEGMAAEAESLRKTIAAEAQAGEEWRAECGGAERRLAAAEARALAAEAELAEADAEITSTEIMLADERRMRFAAEAERDALREALAYARMGLDRIHTALMSTGPKQAAGEMVAHFRDAAARALTEKNNG